MFWVFGKRLVVSSQVCSVAWPMNTDDKCSNAEMNVCIYGLGHARVDRCIRWCIVLRVSRCGEVGPWKCPWPLLIMTLLIFNVFIIPNWEISSSACKHKIFTWSASAAGIVYPRFTHSDGSGRGNPWNGSWCDAISCQCLLPNVINSMFRVKLCHSCSLLPLVLGKLLGEKDFAKTCFIFFLFLKHLNSVSDHTGVLL